MRDEQLATFRDTFDPEYYVCLTIITSAATFWLYSSSLEVSTVSFIVQMSLPVAMIRTAFKLSLLLAYGSTAWIWLARAQTTSVVCKSSSNWVRVNSSHYLLLRATDLTG